VPKPLPFHNAAFCKLRKEMRFSIHDNNGTWGLPEELTELVFGIWNRCKRRGTVADGIKLWASLRVLRPKLNFLRDVLVL